MVIAKAVNLSSVEDPRNSRTFFKYHFSLLADVVAFVRQVLYKRPTKNSIYDLVPAADAEHGHVLR